MDIFIEFRKLLASCYRYELIYCKLASARAKARTKPDLKQSRSMNERAMKSSGNEREM